MDRKVLVSVYHYPASAQKAQDFSPLVAGGEVQSYNSPSGYRLILMVDSQSRARLWAAMQENHEV